MFEDITYRVGSIISNTCSLTEYDGKALKFNLVKRPRIGDICTDGSHVGIVSGRGKTISASALTNKIVENDWGFRENSGKPQPNVRFYRYNGR